MKKVILLTSILLLLFVACHQEDKSSDDVKQDISTKETFLDKLAQLKNTNDSIILTDFNTAKINALLIDSTEIDAEDTFSHKTKEIKLSDYKAIKKDDILSITNTFALVKITSLEDYYTRLLTISVDKKPIESMLIATSFGNNNFNVERTYTYDITKGIAFISDLRKDFSPDGEKETTYTKTYKIGVTKDGHFVLKD